jgi:hypothetical protein
MDCADRITVQATEQTLEPIRMMARLAALSAVTVRELAARRRFDVTVRKRWPDGPRQPPAYGWDVREVEESGAARSAGLELSSSAGAAEAFGDPEDAYWSAVEAIQASVAATPAAER